MRYRAVYWLAFPSLLIALLAASFRSRGVTELLWDGAINLGFLLLQFALLSVYFSLKKGRLVNITKGLLGWGDILFLLCLGFFLSPLNYLFFYIGSLLAVLVITGVVLLRNREAGERVPLAGLQSLLFALALLADWNSNMINLNSDNWLLTIPSL